MPPSVDHLPRYHITTSTTATTAPRPSPAFSEKLDRHHKRQSAQTTVRESRVLIAGGTFGAIFLALLLERLGIPYYLFDGGVKVQHLGSALALGPSILPVFEQLGITTLLASISLPCPTLQIYNHKLKKLGAIAMKEQSERTGYEYLICSRSNLYELLLTQLNPANVVIGKKILWYEENELGVNLCCSDNSIYSGDILVGADGVHSRVRHTLHKVLAKKNMLSKSDSQPIKPSYVLVAGVTHRQSAERYQCLKDPFVHFCSVVGVQGRGWNVINIPDDQICWAMWVQLDSAKSAQIEDTEDVELGVENTEPIVELFRDMPCPYGGTMGDLVNSTSEDLKSKVYIEEKLFNIWHHGRVVLLGDACHSLLPWSGQSTPSEIHDAVVLANCLFEIKDLSLKSITSAFKDYRQQRFPVAKSQYAHSRSIAKLLCGQSWKDRFSRYAVFNWVPQSYFQRMLEEVITYRPQASFLTHAENRGITPAVPQRPWKQWSEEEVTKRVTAVWEKGRGSR